MTNCIFHRLIAFAGTILLLSGCVPDNDFEDTPQGNLDALWNIIDQRYCFLDYKAEEYGLDWDKVHDQYSSMLSADMSDIGLFEVLGRMLQELRDGHVNLSMTGNTSRYWYWFQDYPLNYSEELVWKYLGADFRISSGMYYRILDDNVGYIRYDSFSNAVSDSGLDAIFAHMILCNGLIIDIRSNDGGNLSNETKLISRFVNEKTLVGYIMYKTGPGHDDFSEPFERYAEPEMKHLRWQKPVVILTNRGCFSAANAFVSDMSALDNVTVIGDRTGGGSGIPASSELPNGWSVRYSGSPMLDVDGKHVEFGVEPDISVALLEADRVNGKDTMIEAARAYLGSLYTSK